MARVDEPGRDGSRQPRRTLGDRDQDLMPHLEDLRRRLNEAREYLGSETLIARRKELEVTLAQPDLWNDPETARTVTTEYGRISDDIDRLDDLSARLADAGELYLLAIDEGDGVLRADVAVTLESLAGELHSLEMRSLFSGEHDERDVVAEVHAGAGGTDAQDWAEMLLRMYLRWAERRGFEVELDEVTAGQEAGILSATMIIKGRYAYGLLLAEKGVHRLVRMSPFDAQKRRQTSFASMDVVPFLDDLSDDVEIDDKDLRVDTYRSSGAGGQHVNVTDSAVRLTHLPTGLVVSCQNERSQHQNKARAMQVLAAKLAQLQREQRKAEIDALSGPQTGISWGNQIRSYVLAPFQLVKDLRTQYETGNVTAVLDGDLDAFMEAYLYWRKASHQEE